MTLSTHTSGIPFCSLLFCCANFHCCLVYSQRSFNTVKRNFEKDCDNLGLKPHEVRGLLLLQCCSNLKILPLPNLTIASIGNYVVLMLLMPHKTSWRQQRNERVCYHMFQFYFFIFQIYLGTDT